MDRPRHAGTLPIFLLALVSRVALPATELSPLLPHLKPQLSIADREEIERLVARQRGVNANIVAMRVEQPDVVTLHTGILSGPRSGGGRVLRATKSNGAWSIVVVDHWKA
jgi:hypothetical protein